MAYCSPRRVASVHFQPVQDALYAEATACVRTLQIARELGIRKVIECDASSLQSAPREKLTKGRMEFYSEGHAYLMHHPFFPGVLVQLCLRSCNSVAHELAKFGATSMDQSYICPWYDDFPDFVVCRASSDLADGNC